MNLEKAVNHSGIGRSLYSDMTWSREEMIKLNHYSSRILIDSWVPLAGAIALTPFALVGAASVKISEPSKPAFYLKELYTSDNSRQYQIKTRTMKEDADSQRDLLIAQGILNPAGLKSQSDPRITSVGKILRRTGLDEVWQLWQLTAHVYSKKGFFYDKKRHYHYTVSPRPQTKKSIAEAPTELKEILGKNRTGITGYFQVGEGKEGECARVFHEEFETKWIIPKMINVLLKTPLAMVSGHNA